MRTLAEAIARVGRLLGELLNPSGRPALAPAPVPVRVRPPRRR
jgi:hypothetical protein